jgi:hypothetical protein
VHVFGYYGHTLDANFCSRVFAACYRYRARPTVEVSAFDYRRVRSYRLIVCTSTFLGNSEGFGHGFKPWPNKFLESISVGQHVLSRITCSGAASIIAGTNVMAEAYLHIGLWTTCTRIRPPWILAFGILTPLDFGLQGFDPLGL